MLHTNSWFLYARLQLSVAAVERLKVVADSTCIKFEKLKKIEQNLDFPFYAPGEDSA